MRYVAGGEAVGRVVAWRGGGAGGGRRAGLVGHGVWAASGVALTAVQLVPVACQFLGTVGLS